MTNFFESVQRTDEWHKQRIGRITGSRVGAILGLSPHRTRADVLREMVREYHGAPSEFVDNPAVAYGRNFEAEALLAFKRLAGFNVEECGFFPKDDFLGASPDGLVGTNGVLEIKVPYSMRGKTVDKFKPLADQPHYFAQVQMEMYCTGRQYAYFFQYAPAEGDPLSNDYLAPRNRCEIVDIDHGWIESNMLALRQFYDEYLDAVKNPEPYLAAQRPTIDGYRAVQIVERIVEIRAQEDELKAEREELMAELVQIAGEKNAEIAGHKLTKVERKGSISYADAVKSLAPDADLEPYRGKPSASWRLS